MARSNHRMQARVERALHGHRVVHAVANGRSEHGLCSGPWPGCGATPVKVRGQPPEDAVTRQNR